MRRRVLFPRRSRNVFPCAPGDSALFLLVNDTPADVVGQSLAEFGGNLYHTSLGDEAEQIFHKAMEQEEIKMAVIAHQAA